jgi:hypothetical protein
MLSLYDFRRKCGSVDDSYRIEQYVAERFLPKTWTFSWGGPITEFGSMIATVTPTKWKTRRAATRQQIAAGQLTINVSCLRRRIAPHDCVSIGSRIPYSGSQSSSICPQRNDRIDSTRAERRPQTCL